MLLLLVYTTTVNCTCQQRVNSNERLHLPLSCLGERVERQWWMKIRRGRYKYGGAEPNDAIKNQRRGPGKPHHETTHYLEKARWLEVQ